MTIVHIFCQCLGECEECDSDVMVCNWISMAGIYPLSQIFSRSPRLVLSMGRKMCVNSNTANTTQVQVKATPVKFLILSFFYPTPNYYFSLTLFHWNKHIIVFYEAVCLNTFSFPWLLFVGPIESACSFGIPNMIYLTTLSAILISVCLPLLSGKKHPLRSFTLLLSSVCSWLCAPSPDPHAHGSPTFTPANVESRQVTSKYMTLSLEKTISMSYGMMK